MAICDPRDINPLGVLPPVTGTAGQYLVAGGGITISSNPTWQSLNLDLPNNKDFKEIQARLSAIEKRLAILRPDETVMAKYESLQEAYEAYNIIEKLINEKS